MGLPLHAIQSLSSLSMSSFPLSGGKIHWYRFQWPLFIYVPRCCPALSLPHFLKRSLDSSPPLQNVRSLQFLPCSCPFPRQIDYLQFGIENRVHLRLALVEIGISCENCMTATPRELRHPIDILGTKIARFADGRNLPARTQCYLPYRIHNVERYVFIGPNSQAANAHSK